MPRLVKVTTKGQMTLPVDVRRELNVQPGDYLMLRIHGAEIRLTKVSAAEPLSENDPIWDLIGAGRSGLTRVAEEHDKYLAEGEQDRWDRP